MPRSSYAGQVGHQWARTPTLWNKTSRAHYLVLEGLCPVEHADREELELVAAIRQPHVASRSESAHDGEAEIPVSLLQSVWVPNVRTCAR
jgi:hypothetical protein